ncbi:motile sperm domain-containing protein 1-like [Dermacentor andersoni]|uniref:motile sperm domain-containing protein 1-like n=1 Tax=Dermacentor andersoni TaxID=34620 RepID=UPI0021552120|nr:motile sperm domain-containing protein 1-like [Dermacentor andersoni]
MLRGREEFSSQSIPPTGLQADDCKEARRRDGAVREGPPEANKAVLQATDSYLPVAVSPPQLDFYIDEQEGHTQVLTLYNVNDHPVHFLLMSNAPRRFSVSGRAGIITPHCYTDIVVHHCDLSEGNVGVKDNLRVVMRKQGSRLQGFRDVPAILWATRSSSDDEEEKEDEDDLSQKDSTQLQPLVEQGQKKGWTAFGQDPLVLFVVLACVVVLMLPLEDARDTSSHPLLAHLPMSHEHKLFAAYILGLMTTLIVRK